MSTRYDITKDPRFLAFNRLATENYGSGNITDSNKYSIGFEEFCEKIENGEVVDSNNVLNNYNRSNWDSRVERSFEKTDPALGHKVLEILKKSYTLGMVDKNNMLLRQKAIDAYKHSI